jgi:3-oxoadipate enol-lactonase
MIMATDPDGYASCCEAIGEMDLRGDLPTVTAPTLVVAGTHDPATPPRHAETITSLIPDARMETVDAAHLANWEQPVAINELLRAHLEGANDD